MPALSLALPGREISRGESGSVLVSIWFRKVPSSQINSDVPHSDSDRLLRFLEVASHVLNGIWQVGRACDSGQVQSHKWSLCVKENVAHGRCNPPCSGLPAACGVLGQRPQKIPHWLRRKKSMFGIGVAAPTLPTSGYHQ